MASIVSVKCGFSPRNNIRLESSVLQPGEKSIPICGFKVTVVLLNGEDPSRPPLPVRDRFIGGTAFSKQPTIDLVIPAAGKYQPILANSTLLIRNSLAQLNPCSGETVRYRLEEC
jgi:hypothetical protein